jgi:hypothetical protein
MEAVDERRNAPRDPAAQDLRAGDDCALRDHDARRRSSRGPRSKRFTEIDVERSIVVEPDGSYRMVISNRPRSIGPIYKGKPFGYPGGGRPGIIFFNDEGRRTAASPSPARRTPTAPTLRRAGFPSISSTRTRSSTSSTPRRTASGEPDSRSRTEPMSTSTRWSRHATRS